MNEEETRRPFSRRYGYVPNDREITIREDAPEEFRVNLLYIARQASLPDSALLNVICQILRKFPSQSDWHGSWEQAQDLVCKCEWFRVYDFDRAHDFEISINEHFREAAIGWQLVNGIIQARGSEAFESLVSGARETLAAAMLPTASDQIHEALRDLSRRPHPDLAGAIQHAMAALECVAREVCGETKLT